MTRVIVHAGFHKTGTSSLQGYLAQHRAAFKPWFDYYGQSDFKMAGARARIFAQRQFPWRLRAFRRALRAFLTSLPESETLVLSRENFSGSMPGHRSWSGRTLKDFHTAAEPLLQVVIGELKRRFGADTQVDLLYTTREREAWIRSVYGHLLRSIHLTTTFAEFRAQFPNLPDLEAEAARIGHALGCTVYTRPMEELIATRPGPAKAVLDLVGVPAEVWQALPEAEHANAGQSRELEAAFFELNHSGKSKAELKQIKDRMINKARARASSGENADKT